jgi:hypothetical protein
MAAVSGKLLPRKIADTPEAHRYLHWVTIKDEGNAYNKAMKLVLLCIRDDIPTEPWTTSSALQQVNTSQHLSALISYLVGCSQAKGPSWKKAGHKAEKD